MTAAIGLALALAISHPAPPVNVVVGDIGSHALVVKEIGFDRFADEGPVLHGWLCRRAPGTPIQRLAVIAEDQAGNSIWHGVVTTPTFAPGRTKECRALRIDVPADIASQVRLWRLARP